jgi:hypothetical protein
MSESLVGTRVYLKAPQPTATVQSFQIHKAVALLRHVSMLRAQKQNREDYEQRNFSRA